MAATVYMTREAGQYPAPHEADVHPDEVENYRRGGWVEADSDTRPATDGTDAEQAGPASGASEAGGTESVSAPATKPGKKAK